MRRLLRNAASIRHTRPAQLAWRARRMVARLVAERRAETLLNALRARAESLMGGLVLADAPQPLPPRSGMIRRSGDTILVRLLGHEVTFDRTIDWRLASSGRVSQLWGFHLHYHEFLEEVGAVELERIVADWIASNPPYAPRFWYDSWSSYALSLRVVVWMQQIDRRRGELTPEFVAAAARSLLEQLLFLESNLELDVRGNHLIKNLKALLFGARFLRCNAGRRWQERAISLLAPELSEQILPDGLHFERSPAYHAQVFADLLECHEVLGGGPLKERLASRLAAMAQALADTTHPDGLPSLFNDGGLHMAYGANDLLAAWAAISGQRPVQRPEFEFEAAGYFGLRNGGDLLLVDAGRIAPDFLPGHGHGDILAFEWTVAGRRLLVDTGVFEYAAGPKRDRSKATASHNTVTVDGADQCDFFGSFRVGRRANVAVERVALETGDLDLTASHDGFRRLSGVGTHRRTVRGRVSEFVVDDTVEGTRGISEAWLILHPEARVSVDGVRATITSDRVIAEIVASAPINPGPWEWWPDFGVAIPTTRLRIAYGPLPAKGRLQFKVVARP